MVLSLYGVKKPTSLTIVDQQQVNNDRGSKNLQVSCCYDLKKGQDTVSIEHSCLVNAGNTWNIDVKCRPKQMVVKAPSGQSDRWRSLKEVYPDAKIEHKHNDIEVTLPVLPEDIEIAAFGRPEKNDKKRMQIAAFAEQPRQGQNWKILIYLVDDTTTAYKQVCQKEEQRHRKVLVPVAGIFVSNSDEDIRIELDALEHGWKIKGSKVKTIKASAAWNPPENATDFPSCHFDIIHVDKTKQSFFCGITASHENDTARSEIVTYFKRERGQEIIQTSKNLPKASKYQCLQSKDAGESLSIFWLWLFFLRSLVVQGLHSRGTVPTNQNQRFMTKKDNSADTLNKISVHLTEQTLGFPHV
ncbi:uncharacterized protein [Montipora capricornis]|uniref:uncharacterized protein isoform X1 n=1 Tax=Montipora capricornis TaxID=246305 RepID=UPI0035F181EF